ncbi:hypothetical protein B0H14DRAFT_312341 [Mycena olivaceomarginata]|nr:hypothetical protein B0H14DRAFT_312341 [Mycena olivaceomarginata]
MSDDKPRYRLKYAVSDCEECIGPKPCNGATTGKGELQFGTPVQVMGTSFFAWRNYHCIMKKVFYPQVFIASQWVRESNGGRPSTLQPGFRERPSRDEDIPDSARKTVAAGCHQPSELHIGRPQTATN